MSTSMSLSIGKSLEDTFTDCGRRFTLKTTLMLLDQLICRMEILHTKSYIHRQVCMEWS